MYVTLIMEPFQQFYKLNCKGNDTFDAKMSLVNFQNIFDTQS